MSQRMDFITQETRIRSLKRPSGVSDLCSLAGHEGWSREEGICDVEYI